MAVIRKRVLCPQQLRKVPPQCSRIDHRLVRDRHIAGKSAETPALYLFLVTVADGQGLSDYSDAGIGKLLPLDGPALDRARRELIQTRLIAYDRPLCQVLSLDQPDGPRGGTPQTLGQILQQTLDTPRLTSRDRSQGDRWQSPAASQGQVGRPT